MKNNGYYYKPFRGTMKRSDGIAMVSFLIMPFEK